MLAIAKLDPISRDITVMVDRALGPAATASALQEHARRALAEGQVINRSALGYTPNHTISVDGRLNADISSARADSTIIIEFDLLLDLFSWIGEQLVLRSPVGQSNDKRPRHPGLYRASHIFMADGNQIDPGAEPPPAFEYAFVNTQPYARKIERGLSDQAPDGVYEQVAKEAQRRFGNIAKVRFGYRSLVGMSDLESWASNTSLVRKGKRGPRRMNESKRSEWLRRQPAVLIFVRDR